MKLIPKSIFKKDAVEIAKFLLGKILNYNGCSGIIVETEAYKNDPASHAARKTPRSQIMYESYGKWYIYFIYGMYYCLNVTTNSDGPGAVLIRAVQPLNGLAKMKKARKTEYIKNLCSGPGKLCEAFGITKKLNGTEVNDKIKLYYSNLTDFNIKSGPRIGIEKGLEFDWRFYIENNEFVSKINKK